MFFQVEEVPLIEVLLSCCIFFLDEHRAHTSLMLSTSSSLFLSIVHYFLKINCMLEVTISGTALSVYNVNTV